MAARSENVLFLPQNLDIWGQKSIFCIVIQILLMEQITTIPGATTFPLGPPPKKFRFRARGHFWGSPMFLAVFGLCHFGPTRFVRGLDKSCVLSSHNRFCLTVITRAWTSYAAARALSIALYSNYGACIQEP